MNQFGSTNSLTDHLKQSLTAAHQLAEELRQDTVQAEHLLYGLLMVRGSLSGELLHRLTISPDRVKAFIVSTYGQYTTTHVPRLSATAKGLLQHAVLLAGTAGHRYVGTEHLLTALVTKPLLGVRDIFLMHQISLPQLGQQLQLILRSTGRFADILSAANSDGADREEAGLFGNSSANNASALELFTVDLTTDTIQQTIDPVIGREAEIERVTQILCRRTKNNPILLGDPGVGKTAIVEGLAKKIMVGTVPEVLTNKRILMLDLGLLLAGTMYRGEFEQRLKNVIAEINKDDSIILFIDEIHTLTGAGAAPGSMDAANILKPALARGQIRCIGATTLDEYRKHIESDPALERRFQPVIVAEPTPDKALQILRGIKENYERYHHVTITPAALESSVRLSTRYLPERRLPDKAIDVIDEAAARYRVTQPGSGLPKKIHEIEHGITLLQKKKRGAITAERYPEALDYKSQEAIAQRQLAAVQAEWAIHQQRIIGTVTERDVAELVAKMTGVPLAELATDDQAKLKHLAQRLQEHVIGQTEAIAELTRAIRRSRAGLATAKRPIGSFIFIGPSGVGKTELAKALAKELFEDEQALVKIDMSEFKEGFNVSKLIGSPPGYVGYKESGQLTEAVRRKPYSVVLFDEIEKAHPEIFNILLQVMEDGELTDATGKKINFRNTIIIMTSNVGLKEFIGSKHIGFGASASRPEITTDLKRHLLKSLGDWFRPEFLNRVDGVLFFNPLGLTELKKITILQLQELNQQLASQGLKLRANPAAIQFLATQGADQEQGARLIRKNVQELVATPLADKILAQEVTKGDIIEITTHDGQLVLQP
ncbi:MAG: ATP-dependent Clp protease ATP-binding subunit [Patescibacteria group bacterium]